MGWLLFGCILLAATSDVQSHIVKRDLSYIKDLVVSKLFGKETIFIQQPEIPKNETYQLFKIKGYDNVLLKITHKPKYKTEEYAENDKGKDKVIVSPEIAIIGSYLGTKTQGETLLAIEIAKNLLKSGILSEYHDGFVQDGTVPIRGQFADNFAHEFIKPLEVYTEEKGPIYVLSDQANGLKVVNSALLQDYSAGSPHVVTPEVQYKPISKYSYTQKGEHADMIYESYNNKDVIVTKTVKEPPLPQYLRLRFAEVASIGANPLYVKHQPVAVITENMVQPMVVSSSDGTMYPSVVVPENTEVQIIPSFVKERFPSDGKPVSENSGYVVANYINSGSVSGYRYPSLPSMPLVVPNSKHDSTNIRDQEADKINQFIKDKLSEVNKSESNFTSNILCNDTDGGTKSNDSETTTKPNINVNESNRVVMSKYLYKQINSKSNDNFTVVKLDDTQVATDSSKPMEENPKELSKDFVFVPPKEVNVPPPNMIPKTNNINNEKNKEEVVSSETENYPKAFLEKLKENNNWNKATNISGTLKTNNQHSLAKEPIVVPENQPADISKPIKKRYPGILNKGNKTVLKPYSGGPVF